MDSPSKFESLALRFAPYVGDLHEFFATSGMPFGSPEDLVPFAAGIAEPGSFRDDMCSIVRSIIYRENKTIPIVDLLQLLVVAAGGPRVDDTAADLHEPIRQLLSFVREVYRSLQHRSVQPISDVQPATARQTPLPSVPALPPAAQPIGPSERSSEIFTAGPVQGDPAAVENFAQTLHDEPASEPEPRPESESNVEAESPFSSPPPVASQGSARLSEIDEPPAIAEPLAKPANVQASTSEVGARPNLRPLNPSGKSYGGYRANAVRTTVALAAGLLLAFGGWLTLHHARVPPSPGSGVAAPQKLPLHHVPPIGSNPVAFPQPTEMAATGKASPAEPMDPVAENVGKPDSAARPSARHENSRQDSAPSLSAQPENIRMPARTSVTENRFATPEPLPKAIYAEKPEATIAESGRSSRPERHSAAISVSSGIMASHLLAAPPPEYPTLAKFTHVEGQVVLQAFVARDGSVMATHILRGHHMLRGAAEHAVRRWRYRPFLVEGRATDVATIVTVDFRLRP
ncbi:MAG: energy transducer TonB [Janthinobacterium lividum]